MTIHATLEADLFAILVEILGDQKLERNALRILVGARGYELGRPYLNLCQQGLIEERRVRLGFFARLFGARETLWVRVTDHGRKIAADMAVPALAEAFPVAEEIAPAPHPADPIPPASVDVAPDPLPPITLDAASPDLTPDAIADAAQVLPPALPKRPRRFTPSDFTEALGGTPLDTGFQIPASDRIDGLSESLGLLGFELTDTGRLLAVNRWTQGQRDAQVALEIVTTALAHAVRLNATGTTQLDLQATAGLMGRLHETFAAYVAEGLLDAESLTEAVGRMEGFLGEAVGATGVDEYLSDPLRGMAPTAVCPDDIYLRAEVEED